MWRKDDCTVALDLALTQLQNLDLTLNVSVNSATRETYKHVYTKQTMPNVTQAGILMGLLSVRVGMHVMRQLAIAAQCHSVIAMQCHSLHIQRFAHLQMAISRISYVNESPGLIAIPM